MNYTNSRTEFSFWAIWSAPLLVATDIANLTEAKKSILLNEEVLAVHKDPLWIAGEQAHKKLLSSSIDLILLICVEFY